MRFFRGKAHRLLFISLVMAVAIAINGGNVQAYYGGIGGSSLLGNYGLYGGLGGGYSGLSSMYGLYGGLGGGYGLYGGLGSGVGGGYGLYGGLGSGLGGGYGLGALGGLYGGYSGLSSMYGLYGGLGGGYGLYGGLGSGVGGGYGLYGGLGSGLGGGYGLGLSSGLYGGYSGLSSMYGLYGGLGGGLYGLYGGLGSGLGGGYSSGLLGGLGRYGLAENQEELNRQAQVLLFSSLLLPTSTTTSTSALPVVPALPNPTGTWSGTWLSYINLKGGIANFSLVYNPLTLTVSGTAGLLLNKLIPIPISVSGLNSATGFTLSGSYFDPFKLVTYYASYNCTLVSPIFITGTYLIHDALYLESDSGNFNLNLVPLV